MGTFAKGNFTMYFRSEKTYAPEVVEACIGLPAAGYIDGAELYYGIMVNQYE